MLTYMPPKSPLPVHTPMSSSTMSLAILPSSAPMAYNQSSGPTLLAPSPSPAKKPKLSLNTANVPSVFGKGSTSLRLDTLSATSPTTRNTFRNAYDARQMNSRPSKPRLAPLATHITNADEQSPAIEREESYDSAASSASTASTASTIDFSAGEVPYRVPYNVKSILLNSPIARKPARITSFAQSKPMFPATKKVAFRAPLTEDIQNTRYTMKHSDIESSTSTISTLELSPSTNTSAVDDDDDEDNENEQVETVAEVEKKDVSSPHTGDKRESSDEEDDSDTCPATPVAGRKKRHRDWRWTLGPVEPSNEQQQHQSDETDNADQQSDGV